MGRLGEALRALTRLRRRISAGMVRQSGRGVRMRYDNVVQEFPGFLADTPLAHMAFGCFLRSPGDGVGQANLFAARDARPVEPASGGRGAALSLFMGPLFMVRPPAGHITAVAGDAAVWP